MPAESRRQIQSILTAIASTVFPPFLLNISDLINKKCAKLHFLKFFIGVQFFE